MAKLILIVDDSASMRRVVGISLRSSGYDVIEGCDGKDALSKLTGQKVHLIISDVNMPVMDGITVLKKLREDEWGKDAKVVLLTNLSDNEKIAEAIMHGTYDYLVKSDWKIKDVVAKVRERLEG